MFLSEIASELNAIDTKWDKLQFLMELGKEVPTFDESKKVDVNFVPGCVSQVYMDVSLRSGSLHLEGTADALIVRGYVKILIGAFEGMSLSEFEGHADKLIEDFITQTDINSSHLASRANSFGNIFLFIKKKIRDLHE